VSDKYWVVLDPQRKYFPGLTSPLTQPGMRVEPMRENREKLLDQFSPFSANVVKNIQKNPLLEPVSGTMFRFPLRTKKQASESEIRNTFVDKQKILQLFQHFQHNAGNALLFLHNVRSVELAEINEQGHREILFKVSLKGDVNRRGRLRGFIQNKLKIWSRNHKGRDFRTCPEALRETMCSIIKDKKKDIPRDTLKFKMSYFVRGQTSYTEDWWVRTVYLDNDIKQI